MISPKLQKRILIAFGVAGVLAFGFFVLNFAQNPMDARMAELDAEIDAIQVTPLFIVGTSQTNYDEIQKAVQSKNTLWRQLIAPPQQAKPKDPGPNFKHLLNGISATSTTMTINGKPSARIITPAAPRGRWVGVGDVIAGTKVVQINQQHIIVSKMKGPKEYKHNIPRQ